MSRIVAALPRAKWRIAFPRVPVWHKSPTFTFAMLFGVYLNVHLVLRLMEGASLRWDESEQTLFSQRLALGYNDQPPVYTWLLWCVFRFTGVSLAGVYILKLSIIACIYIGLYVLGRRLVSETNAILVSISLLLTPYFAWSAVIDGAHTLLVAAVVPIAALQAIRVLQRPTTFGFALLGLVFGLGVLAKYSFVLLAIALPLALVAIPAYRRRLRDPRILLTIAVAALVVMPHAIWVWNHWELIRERPMHRGGVDTDHALAVRVRDGLLSLGKTALLTVGSLVVVLIALSPKGMTRILTAPAQSDVVRLLGRWLAITAVLLLVLVLLGVSHFRIHWLIPAVVLLPAYAVARIAETPIIAPRRRVFIATVFVGVVVVAALRVAGIATESQSGGKYWAQDRMHEAAGGASGGRGHRQSHVHRRTSACVRQFAGAAPRTCASFALITRRSRVIARTTSVTSFGMRRSSQAWGIPWRNGSGQMRTLRVDWTTATYVDMPVELPGHGLRRIGLARLRPAGS